MTTISAQVRSKGPRSSVADSHERRRIPRSILLAGGFHLLIALALLPAAHPYDLAALTGSSDAWMRWGLPLSFKWKFGSDLTVLSIGAQGARWILMNLGMSGAAALTVAWKLPLVLANLMAAAGLYDIGLRLSVKRPTVLPILWLVSPVVIWVAAGHGQLETLTSASVIVALCLILRGRWITAGLAIGLGVGIEYLPLLVVLVVGFWIAAGLATRKDGLRFAAGLSIGLALCFGPSLLTEVGRKSLEGGLHSTVQATHIPNSGVVAVNPSVWRLFDVHPGILWIVAFLGVVGLAGFALTRRARNGSPITQARMFVGLSGVMFLAIGVMDPGSLPQFAVLTALGLVLLVPIIPIAPLVIVVAPTLQLATGLFYILGGSFSSYWYDMWAKSGDQGWQIVPQSSSLALLAGDFAITLILLGLGKAMRDAGSDNGGVSRRRKFVGSVNLGVLSACLAGGLVSAGFATYSLQPSYWSAIGSKGPANLVDWTSDTQVRPLTVSDVHGSMRITTPSALAEANAQSNVHGRYALQFSSPALLNAQLGGSPQSVNSQRLWSVKIPNWEKDSKSTSSLWTEIILGNHMWARAQTGSEILDSAPAITTSSGTYLANSTRWLVPGWEELTFALPASSVDNSGVLRVRFDGVRQGTVWNGSRSGRWVVVGLRQANYSTSTADQTGSAIFTPPIVGSDPTSTGTALLSSTRSTFEVSQMSVGGRPAHLSGAELVWPSTTPLTRTLGKGLLISIGVLDLLVLLGGVSLLCWKLLGQGVTERQHRLASSLAVT